MNKEISTLLKEVKDLKIYYDQAKEQGNQELQAHFKELIEEKSNRIKYLREKDERIREIKAKKHELKRSIEDDEVVRGQSDKIKELERKVAEEKKKKLIEEKKLKRDRELKRKAEEREKALERERIREEERLRKKANLKEIKFGTLAIIIALIILFILMFLRFLFPINSEEESILTFPSAYFVIARIYTIGLMITIIIFTYIQENLKNMLFLRIYSIFSLFLVFLTFGGIAYINISYRDFDFGTYFFIPGILILVLIFIFTKLVYRNKLEYQYVRKYEEEDDDEYYDEY